MSGLFWVLISLAVTLFAVLLAVWLGRNRRPTEKYEQIDTFRRFREAMEDEAARRRASEGESQPATRSTEGGAEPATRSGQ